MSPRSPRAFVLTFLAIVGSAVVAIVGFNLVIDPFWRFNLVSIEGVNAQRTQLSTWARLGKAGIVCRMQPTKAILGTSRAEVGLDPQHPGFQAIPGPTYNLALAGSGIQELSLLLKHAKYASPNLKQVVIALDFLMFNAHREAVVFGTEVLYFDPERLLSSPSDSCWRNLAHDFNQLLWVKGVSYSYATTREQVAESRKQDHVVNWISIYDALGYRGDHFRALEGQQKIHGHRYLVDAASRRHAGQERYYASRVWRPAPENRFCLSVPGKPDPIGLFRDMIRFGYENGLDIRFVINPIHARMLFALYEIGLWPTYEDWKRELVDALEDEAKRAGAPVLPLWDFSGVNTVTAETIPPADDRQTKMKWFWEPSHYTSDAGDMMLDKVLGHRNAQRDIPDDFGIRLDASSVDGWTKRTRAGLRRYMDSHPDEIGIVQEALAPILQTSTGSNCGHDMEAVIAGSEALQRGDRAAAEAAFARAEAIHESDRRRYAEIDAPFREPAFEAALKTARQGHVVERRLGDWIAYQTRGLERTKQGNDAGAISDFTEAIVLGPPNTALHYLRGTTRLKTRDYEGATEDFELGLKIDPQNQTLKTLREQALAGAQHQAIDPAAASEFQRRADEKRARGDLAGAISDYSEAIRVSAPNTALHFLRGTALLQVGDAGAAANDFRAGLKLDPDNVALKELLGKAQAGGEASRGGP